MYRFFKKRLLFFSLLFLFAGTLLFFHHFLICFGTKIFINSHLSYGQIHGFNYESISFEKGGVFLRNVYISKLDKDLKEQMNAKVDKLGLTFSFNMFPFHLRSLIEIHQPKIRVTKPPRFKAGYFKKEKMANLLKRLLFKYKFLLEEGSLSFTEDPLTHFYFSIKTEKGKEKKGKLCLALSKDQLDKASFTSQFFLKNKTLFFDISLDHFDMVPFFLKGKQLLPFVDPGIELSQGTLSGFLNFSVDDKCHISSIRYNLNLFELSACHACYGMTFLANQISLKEHFTSNEEMGSFQGHPFFEKIWPYFVGDGTLHGARISFEDPKTKQPKGLLDFRGRLTFSSKNEPIAECLGFFIYEGNAYPFSLNAEGIIENHKTWKCAIDLSLMEEKSEPMRAVISLKKGTEKGVLFESYFENLSTGLQGIVEYLLKVKYPYLASYRIQAETFSGEIAGVFKEKKLKFLELKTLTAKNFLLVDKHSQLNLRAQWIKGEGEFDFSQLDFFDGTFWKAEITEGSIHIADQLHVDKICAHLAMHDQYLTPSTIEANIYRTKVKMTLEGLYNFLNLNLNFKFFPSDFFYLFGQDHGKQDACISPWLINLEIKVKKDKEKLFTEGVLKKGVKKKLLDFGLCWDFFELFSKGFVEGFKEGHFKSEGLSHEFVNLPLELWKSGFRFEGDLPLEGNFDRKKVDLRCDLSQIHAVSDEWVLDTSSTSTPRLFSHFCFDLVQKKWQGKICLREATLYHLRLDLLFERFKCDVDLNEKTLVFQNFSTQLLGVDFKGKANLEYHSQNNGDLKIYAHTISGAASDVGNLLRRFNVFSKVNFPVEGLVTNGKKGMVLHACLGKKNQIVRWDVDLQLTEASYEFYPHLRCENFSTKIVWTWDEKTLHLLESKGFIRLDHENKQKEYELNLPLAYFNFHKNIGDFDLRLETSTHEICRLVGKLKKKQATDQFILDIDSELTRFFGTKIEFESVVLSDENKIENLVFQADFCARDLFHHLDFISYTKLLPIEISWISKIEEMRFEGNAALKVAFSRPSESFSFEVKSPHFIFGNYDFKHLEIYAERKGKCFEFKRLHANDLDMTLLMVKKEGIWQIPSFELGWEDLCLKSQDGYLDWKKKEILLPLKKGHLNLKPFLGLFPTLKELDHSYFEGKLDFKGMLKIHMSPHIHEGYLDALLDVVGEDFSRAKLHFESVRPFHVSFSPLEGLCLKEGAFDFFHRRSNQLWAKCAFDEIFVSQKKKVWKGRHCQVIVPPEMLYYLGGTHTFPFLKSEEKNLIILGQKLQWDNQIECSFDFSVDENIEVKGRLKEGYYWIGEKAYCINDFRYHWIDEKFFLHLNTLFHETPFDIEAKIDCFPHLKGELSLQETLQEERNQKKSLKIISNWNQTEGFFIQSIEGKLCGLDFFLHHNPKKSFVEEMVLKGQLKIDLPTLSKYLPSKVSHVIDTLEMGKGYEMSGDWTLSKRDFKNSHFNGYLKGRKFQLMGSEIKTLLSRMNLYFGLIELKQFQISDAAGIFTIDSLCFEKEDKHRWKMRLPKFSVQDFRPSLLKKIGRYRGKIKPLTIRQMEFQNIEGIVGDIKSFKGKGSLHFTNTFKRDYNILDIPFEILGRLGLDMGLLVPAYGHLDYVLSEGRIHLIQLKKSYSEGKRSKFYLSPLEPSYIDLDGNLDINIKMKQYVLFKVTEPFTLSIKGAFNAIHYSLK